MPEQYLKGLKESDLLETRGKTLVGTNTRRTLCEKRKGVSRLRKHRDDEDRFKILKI